MQSDDSRCPHCPECRDRGWITGIGENGEKVARRCGCTTRSAVEDRLGQAEIPSRYIDCSLRSFHTSASDDAQSQVLAEAKARCSRYVEGFLELDGVFREGGLLFVGDPGVGKTHLAVAVLRELMVRYGVRGLFVDFGSLVESIQATFDPSAPGTKDSVLRPVQRAEVLVLDELGVRQPTPFVSDVLYAVINERYKARRTTIFTTNYRLEQPRSEGVRLDRGADREAAAGPGLTLEQRVPRMLLSRVFEMATVVHMSGVDDYRREIGMHRNAL